MDKLDIQLCSETGICSIIKGDGTKIDLMPDELSDLLGVLANPKLARQVLMQVDSGFAESLAPDELKQLALHLK